MKNTNFAAFLRRDAAFVGNAVVAVVCICFATLAIASALLDLISLNH